MVAACKRCGAPATVEVNCYSEAAKRLFAVLELCDACAEKMREGTEPLAWEPMIEGECEGYVDVVSTN